MKKLFLYFLILLYAGLSPASSYAVNGYGASCLTGGTTGCLDAINGAILNDGDAAFVVTDGKAYTYALDYDSALTESSPAIISPDSNPGNKRWILQSIGPFNLVSTYGNNISTAVTAIGAVNATTLYIDNTVTVSADTDLSSYSNISFVPINAGIFSVASGKTLTFYKPTKIIAAPNQQVFTGAGTVAWSEGGPVQVGWFSTPAVAAATLVPYSSLEFSGSDTYSITATIEIEQSYTTVNLNDAKLIVPTGSDIDVISVNPDADGVGSTTPLTNIKINGPGVIYNTDGPGTSTKSGLSIKDIRYLFVDNLRIEGFEYGIYNAVRDSNFITNCVLRDNIKNIIIPDFFTTITPQILHLTNNTFARGDNSTHGVSIETVFRDFFINGGSIGGGDFEYGIYAVTGTAVGSSYGLHIDGISAEAIGIEDTSLEITGISNDNPAVVTCTTVPTTIEVGNTVRISAVEGMTEVNGINFTLGAVVTGAGGTFELSGIDSTLYTPYTTGGTAREVHNDHAILHVENANAVTLFNFSIKNSSLESGYPIAVSLEKTQYAVIDSNRFGQTSAAGGIPVTTDNDCAEIQVVDNNFSTGGYANIDYNNATDVYERTAGLEKWSSGGSLRGYRKPIYRSYSAQGTIGAGEDQLHAFILSGSQMPADGGIVIETFGTKTGGAGNKTIKFYFGATAVTVHPAANDEEDWHLRVKVVNFNAGIQRLWWTLTEASSVQAGYEELAIDTTASVTVKTTGECADAADNISAKGAQAWFE